MYYLILIIIFINNSIYSSHIIQETEVRRALDFLPDDLAYVCISFAPEESLCNLSRCSKQMKEYCKKYSKLKFVEYLGSNGYKLRFADGKNKLNLSSYQRYFSLFTSFTTDIVGNLTVLDLGESKINVYNLATILYFGGNSTGLAEINVEYLSNQFRLEESEINVGALAKILYLGGVINLEGFCAGLDILFNLGKKIEDLPTSLPNFVFNLDHLEELILSNNNLGNNLPFLMERFPYFKKLKKLNLSGNSIKDVGIEYLIRALCKLNLEELNLSNNDISDIGAKNLAGILKYRDPKPKIDLRGNNINFAGFTFPLNVFIFMEIILLDSATLRPTTSQITAVQSDHQIRDQGVIPAPIWSFNRVSPLDIANLTRRTINRTLCDLGLTTDELQLEYLLYMLKKNSTLP